MMLEILQFAAASWWNLFVTAAVIIAPAAPLSQLPALIRIAHVRGS